MSVRAYKIAEELGIERNEFVEKARTHGVDLRNAMAMLDEVQISLLREKLSVRKTDVVTEARVERKGGAAVIRRRKRTSETETELAAPTALEAAAIEASLPLAVEPGPAAAPEPEPVPEPAQAAEAETPLQPAAPASEESREGGGVRPRPAPREESAAERAGHSRKQFKEVVNLREQEQLARQVTGRTGVRPTLIDPRVYASPRRKRRDALPVRAAAAAAAPKPGKRVVRAEGTISVADLAHQLGVKAPQVQGKLMALGTMVSIQQTIDVETASRVAKEFGFEVQDVGFQEQSFLEAPVAAEATANLVPRPVVVTVMGHVDHGKTSLLDAIRETNVVAGEAGGITQHIGAYQVTASGHKITFIDTPGHAAFTAMRARGAKVTDLVILVVAASEGIMPQTVEAIAHARAAQVPIVVAINKCDLPDANPRMTRQRLMEHNIVVEDFGGEVLAVDVSATKRSNLGKLLEIVALQAELIEPKADPSRRARGAVLEAELDRGRGPVATVLVQDGTLRRGDVIVVGKHWGRVRMMTDHRGESVEEAPPSFPVRVVGLSGVPDAGDAVHAVESERVAKDIVSNREDKMRELSAAGTRPRVSLEELFASAGGGVLELRVIVKADVQGSAEALREALTKLTTDKVKVNVLHTSVGGITENDVQLAQASEAVIVGFHVRPDAKARRLAESNGVDMRVYQIIYEALDEVKAAMAGLLPPTLKEVVLGQAEVRKIFTIPKAGTVAGCYVTDGLLRRAARCRVVRDGVQVYDGKFGSLKRFKDDVREVQTGFECGIGVDSFNDVKVGDVLEAYEIQEQPAQL